LERYNKEEVTMEIDFPPINNRIYKILNIYDSDPYPEDCYMNWYPKWKRGKKMPRKQILPYQVRMYKTWKHNRKSQWKPKNKR